MKFEHVSVLLEETIEGLNIKPDGIYVDGTLGGGGHALEICKKLNNKGKLIGIDQDENAIEASSYRLRDYQDRISLHRSNYAYMEEVLSKENLAGVDGIVLDLGVSSHQLDEADRGFTYKVNAPLDMRMDQRQTTTAKDIVNTYEESQLFKILKNYGEEKYARSIARNIVKVRAETVISTTEQLVDIIKKSMPVKAHFAGGHPAKRTFQALRIELNQELTVLENTLNKMIDLLNHKGRICVITFHSLEDRIVKNIFRDNQDSCTCPREFPICICQKKPKGKVITRKAIAPSEKEIDINRRAKSSKLRVFEREKE